MPDDPRDHRKPVTPPPGSPSHELEQRDSRIRVGTPIHGVEVERPIDTAIRVARQARDTVAAVDTRVGKLEDRQKSQEIKLEAVGEQVGEILTEARETKKERQEREKRKENRAELELARRHERNMTALKIAVPTLTALGALIAGIIAAYNSSGR